MGYGGVLPFAAGLVGVAASVPGEAAAAAHLVAYGAVILSFIGAVHWGLALTSSGTGTPRLLGVSVVPALIGWVSLLLSVTVALPLLILSFAGLYLYERRFLWQTHFPDWYRTLRTHLTVAVTSLLAAAWALLLVRGSG